MRLPTSDANSHTCIGRIFAKLLSRLHRNVHVKELKMCMWDDDKKKTSLAVHIHHLRKELAPQGFDIIFERHGDGNTFYRMDFLMRRLTSSYDGKK